MTLSENLLAKLSDWTPGEGRHSLSVTHSGTNVDITADSNHPLACSVWQLILTRPAPSGVTVRQWADGIAASVSGLREDLKVLEVDASQNVALLRSDSPTKKGTSVAYYEVRLTGAGTAAVCRYEADTKTSAVRKQVAFPLTHEVLAKLVDDLAA